MCTAIQWPKLETPRLALRELSPDDAIRIAGLANDYDIVRMTTSMPWPFGRADAERFVERACEGDPEREAFFAIETPDDGLIGVIGLDPCEVAEAGVEAPEIGYWVGRPYWRRGYATDAALMVLTWAEAAWGRRFVVAGHFADNPASGAVLVKAGFLYTGEVRSRFSRARGEAAATRMMVRLA